MVRLTELERRSTERRRIDGNDVRGGRMMGVCVRLPLDNRE